MGILQVGWYRPEGYTGAPLPFHGGDSMRTERPRAGTFRDLLVWRKAHEFVLAVYRFTSSFPRSETYGLAQQMRRAAVSIPANIAEGFRRRGYTAHSSLLTSTSTFTDSPLSI